MNQHEYKMPCTLCNGRKDLRFGIPKPLGKITGLPDGEDIFFIDNKQKEWVDTCPLCGGHGYYIFKIIGVQEDEPRRD